MVTTINKTSEQRTMENDYVTILVALQREMIEMKQKNEEEI